MVLLPLDSKHRIKVGLDGIWNSFYFKYIQFTLTLFCMISHFRRLVYVFFFFITLLLLGK